MTLLDETHDPSRSSWVENSAPGSSDFPIQNLPFCIFADRRGARAGVAIGDHVVDIEALLDRELLRGDAAHAARLATGGTLNNLMAAGRTPARDLRRAIADLLDAAKPGANLARSLAERILVARSSVDFRLPAAIGGFTDFLTSSYHTERGGRHTRPDAPLPPAFKHLPIAYNSRASSVRLSGESVHRPHGQWMTDTGQVVFGPTQAFDFELELGAFVCGGNPLGEPVAIGDAERHLFGLVLLNDWSSRDVQRWESHPLGPFLSKSVSTTISPFIVTMDALEPFRAPAFARGEHDPKPLPYLDDAENETRGGIDIDLMCDLTTTQMRQNGLPGTTITRTNFRHMYWTFAQMLAHHTSNGCNLRPADLIGSGTTSGPSDASRACFAELSERGSRPLTLDTGETRRFLEDGDEVTFRGTATRAGFTSIGFGSCNGRVLPSLPYPSVRT
jgi:fumarylacetoacetase